MAKVNVVTKADTVSLSAIATVGGNAAAKPVA